MKVIMKHRFEPLELKILRSLNARMSLSVNDKKNYFKLEKGFRGEQAFDERIQEISCNCIILNDLLLETNNTIFQIDSLLLANEKVYLFEVKNYEGDFYVQGDKWYTINNKQINSPLLQLERCDSLFQQTMQQLGFNLPLESYLIFINPEFMLYEAPLNSSIILPTQLNRFMQKLTSHTTKPNHHYEALTSKLLSIHLEESPFKRIPPYCYEDLKKGIICPSCSEFTHHIYGKSICRACGTSEKIDTAILRSINEHLLLFPDEKITTSAIHEWCNILKSEKQIRRILLKHFNIVGSKRHRYYVDSCSRGFRV